MLGSLRFYVVYLDLAVVDDRPFVADLRQKIVHALLVLALAGIVRLHDVDEVLGRAVARLPENVCSPFHIGHRQCYGRRDWTRARTLCCFGLYFSSFEHAKNLLIIGPNNTKSSSLKRDFLIINYE